MRIRPKDKEVSAFSDLVSMFAFLRDGLDQGVLIAQSWPCAT